MSLQLGFNYTFGVKDLACFLSVLFSVLIIDDSPEPGTECNDILLDENGVQNVGVIQNVID